MEKLSPNRAQLFVRNKYTVFYNVALRSVSKNFSEELQFCSYIYKMLNSLFVQSVIVVCSDSDVEFWADESDTEWNEAVSSEHIKLNKILFL